MEPASSTDAIDALVQLRLGFSPLVRRYPSTDAVNRLIEQRSSFQFPVVTGHSREDILAYYLIVEEEEYPDEYSWPEIDKHKLDMFVYYGYAPELSEGVTHYLQQDNNHKYENRYIPYYLNKAFKSGPWDMSLCYHVVATAYTTLGIGNDTPFDLFKRIGIERGLIYCNDTVIPGRAGLIEEVTDNPSPSTLRWLVGTSQNSYGNRHVALTCVCMLLVKSFDASKTILNFKSMFSRLLSYYITLNSLDDLPVTRVRTLYGRIVNTLEQSRVLHSVDFDPRNYINYYSKVIIYALEVYGLTLTDLEQEVGSDMMSIVFG